MAESVVRFGRRAPINSCKSTKRTETRGRVPSAGGLVRSSRMVVGRRLRRRGCYFLASRAMQGHQVDTIAAGRNSRAAVPDEILTGMPGIDWYVSFLYFGMVGFGMWEAILALPAPDPKLRGLMGIHL